MTRARRLWLTGFLLCAGCGSALAQPPASPSGSSPPQAGPVRAIIRYPTVHEQTVVFEAGGNLWKVGLSGGVASRLTSDSGFDSAPHFSPDGRWIAFTGWYQGNTDVYVMPSGGGPVKRLTYHSINHKVGPGKLRVSRDNTVLGWTPDSRDVVFLSRRASFNPQVMHAYEVPVTGGLPTRLPLPWTGPLSFGPNSHVVAYNKSARSFRPFHRKRYYGGQAQDIWTYNFKTGKSRQITHWKGADTWPMWHGQTLYFTSDRGKNHIENLWSYAFKSKQFRQLTHFTTYDIDRATLGDHAIALSDGGKLYVYHLGNGKLQAVPVRVPLDGTRLQPRWLDGSGHVQSAAVAPNGKLAVFSARGALFTVPAKYGSTQTLTTTPGADQRDPAWSPDGKSIAFIGTRGKHQQIYVRPAAGGAAHALTHTDDVSYQPPITWSPNGRWLTYVDSTQTLWLENVDSGKRWRVAQDKSQARDTFTDVHWSPDSRWLAFSKTLPNRVSGLFLYHVADRSLHKISQGQYNDSDPVFSRDGKYLFFVSDRLVNPAVSDFDFTVAGVSSSGLYAATLARTTPSPLAPRVPQATSAKSHQGGSASGERDERRSKGKQGKPRPISVDLKGLMSRAVRLPVPAADIANVTEAKGVIYYLAGPAVTLNGDPLPGEKSLLRAYNLKKREDRTLAEGVDKLTMSADGSTLLYRADGQWNLRPATFKKQLPPDMMVTLSLGQLRRHVQPRADWQTVYDEAMRDVRDYFVDPKLIAKEWPAIDARYRRLLPRATSLSDVNWLIANAIGSLGESHMYIYGGNQGWKSPSHATADLGVTFALDQPSGRYYLKRIYRGDNTLPGYRAPLAQPGLKVSQGDFVLAINGQTLKAPANPYALLNGTYGTTISLTLAKNPSSDQRWTIHVRPIADAHKLHLLAWIRHNRARVDKLSHGRIGYVYLEDMDTTGMREFVRQYYSQMYKQGLIFDDRWNLGGSIDPVLFDRIARPLTAMTTNRHRWTDPVLAAPAGHMAALINHGSASDGDIFAYMFKERHLGPTVGNRTWGGVRGFFSPFSLLGGGQLVVSEDALYGLDSRWAVENIGVKPDVKVNDEPGQLNRGYDAQLRTAVRVLMKQIRQSPKQYPPPPAWMPAFPPQPSYPDCPASETSGPCG